MTTTVELPNVDIFDPIMCARRWAQCATQQEINVYLNKQIEVNRKVLTDTITAQNAINAASKDKLENHESRIANLESGLTSLDKAQQDLNTAFQALETDNNNFKSNVDLLLNQYQSTINLLQQNIDKISLSNEQLWSEVNNLKSQFDPEKLNQAISGYDNLLRESKAYTDKAAEELQTQIDSVSTNLQNVNTTLQQMIKDSELQMTTNMQSLRNELLSDIEQQNERITLFIQNTDNVLQLQRTWLSNEIARVDKRIDSLTDKVNANKQASDTRFTTEQARVNAAIAALQKSTNESDSDLQSQIDAHYQQMQYAHASNLNEINRVEEESKGRDDKLSESDLKQWETINAILEAQNKINDKMAQLEAYINDQIKSVNESLGLAQTAIENNSGDIEKNAQQITATQEQQGFLKQRTGWQYRQTFLANGANTYRYDLGWGFLNVTTTTSQVSASLELNSGNSGVVSVKATEYGRFQVISNTKYNIIENAAQANYAYGYIIGVSPIAPLMFCMYYDPNTKIVTFLSEYPQTASMNSEIGVAPKIA